MIGHILYRSKQIIRERGIIGFFFWVINCLYKEPLLDRLWVLANYHLHPLWMITG